MLFFQPILSFMLSRKIINVYYDIARKHGNVTVKDIRKYEKLKYKLNQPKLDIDFLKIGSNLAAPPIIVIKNFNMFQNNSVNPKPFYLNNFLLMTSTSLTYL